MAGIAQPWLWAALAALTSWAVPQTAFADGHEASAQQVQQIVDELKQIRILFASQRTPRPGTVAAPRPPQRPHAPDEKVSVSLSAGGYAIGRPDAPLTLVEYTDYQCPFCRQFHVAAFERIKEKYIDTGKLRYVSRDFPLPMHENAREAAAAARCSGDQGKFWELRNVMIINARQLKAENIATYAQDLRLDVDRFRACLAAETHASEIDRDLAEGRSAGVAATPSFVLGRTNGDMLEGIKIVGALPYSTFDSKLQELLRQDAP